MAPRSPRSAVDATTDRVTYDATYPEGMCVNWIAKKHPSAIPASARTVGAIRSKSRCDCATPLAGSRSGVPSKPDFSLGVEGFSVPSPSRRGFRRWRDVLLIYDNVHLSN